MADTTELRRPDCRSGEGGFGVVHFDWDVYRHTLYKVVTVVALATGQTNCRDGMR